MYADGGSGLLISERQRVSDCSETYSAEYANGYANRPRRATVMCSDMTAQYGNCGAKRKRADSYAKLEVRCSIL